MTGLMSYYRLEIQKQNKSNNIKNQIDYIVLFVS